MTVDRERVGPLHRHLEEEVGAEVWSELRVNASGDRGEIQIHVRKPKLRALRESMIGKVDLLAVQDGTLHLVEVENSSAPKTVLRDVAEMLVGRYVRIPREEDSEWHARPIQQARGLVVVTCEVDAAAQDVVQMLDCVVRSNTGHEPAIGAVSLVAFEDVLRCTSLATLYKRDDLPARGAAG